MSTKPYFPKNVEDSITSTVISELYAEGLQVDESAIRRYIQDAKSVYENAILSGVAEGLFLATVKGNEFAYKIRQPSQDEIDDILESAKVKSKELEDSGKLNKSGLKQKEKHYPNNHAAKMAAKKQRKREIVYATKQQKIRDSFKELPNAAQVNEALIRVRSTRLSHALLCTRNSPKLGTEATPIVSNVLEVKNERDNKITV